MDKTEFAAICIGGLIILEAIALFKGYDGAYLASITAIIGGTIGAIFGFVGKAKLEEKLGE